MATRLFVVLSDPLHDAHASSGIAQRHGLANVLRDELFNVLPPQWFARNQHTLETECRLTLSGCLASDRGGGRRQGSPRFAVNHRARRQLSIRGISGVDLCD